MPLCPVAENGRSVMHDTENDKMPNKKVDDSFPIEGHKAESLKISRSWSAIEENSSVKQQGGTFHVRRSLWRYFPRQIV